MDDDDYCEETKGDTAAVARWKRNPAADGYQLSCKAKGVKEKRVNINNPKTLKKTVRNLKAGKKYTFKLRTFNKVYNPSRGKIEKVYGKWSNAKKSKARK